MKIFNYSDLPVVIRNVAIDDREIYLPESIERWHIQHNGIDFIPPSSDERNVVMTIHNAGTANQYQYRTETFSTPDIWVWIGLMISFFSFYVIVRLIQKIRTR